MDATRFLTCAHCAGAIGAYEPVWWQRPDGTLSASSYLRARDDPQFPLAGSAFFHRDCRTASGEPPS
jgi:hypothetical protein